MVLETTPKTDFRHTMQSLSDRSFIETRFRSAISVSDLPDKTKFLQDAEMEIRGYEIEISSLESTILALKQKKEEVKRCMAISTSLFAPVHRLPTEILQCIFDFACAVTPYYEDNWFLSPDEPILAVLTISATCGRWRNIALSTSSLWSGIGLDLRGARTSGHYHGLTFLVHLFLDRSNLSSLTIFLSLGGTTINDDVKPCLEELVHQSHRWQRLYLWGITRDDLTSNLFRPVRRNLPNLIKLDVTGDRRTGAVRDLVPFHCDLFEYCPRMSSLAFQPGSPLMALHSLPWQQVRTLQLCRQVSFYAMPVLSLCHNVENLEVFSIGDIDSHPAYQGHQLSPSIRRLSILEIEDDDEFSCIFRNTTLPKLSELQILGEDGFWEPSRKWKVWQEEPILDFLTRSSCSITILDLKYVPISDAQLIRLLRHIPSLKSLSLEEYPRLMKITNQIFTPFFLNALLIDDLSSKSLLPRLTDLRFVVHAIDLDDQALSRAIISRWNINPLPTSTIGVDRIKIVDIVLLEKEDGIFKRLMDSLHWLSGEGAQVTIAEREERRE